MSENKVSFSVSQTPKGVFFEDIGVRVEKVRKNKYILKSKYGIWEDKDLNGVLVVLEALFGRRYVEMVHQALGE